MGSYLSEPVTEKVSGDEQNDKLNCGHSSMQGWRVSQEDAHNCILDFDANTSLFAVYDGHGGHEVAKYTAQKLPEFLKQLDAYREGKFEKALVDAFLGFDATLAKEDVINILKEIAGDKEAAEDSDDLEDNVDNLYEEAAMPIDKVIEKYKSNIPMLERLKKEVDQLPNSPYLKSRKSKDSEAGGSGHKSSTAGSSQGDVTSSTSKGSKSETNGSDETPHSSTDAKEELPRTKEEVKEETASEVKNGEDIPKPNDEISNSTVEKVEPEDCKKSDAKSEKETKSHQNGDVSTPLDTNSDGVSSSNTKENGKTSSKGKGKALAKTKGMQIPEAKPKRELRAKSAQQLYNELLGGEDSDEDSEDEDVSFVGPQDSDDSDDDDNADAEDDSDDDEEEDMEDEADAEDEDEQEEYEEFARNMREEPGSDSGCTAVVAMLQGSKLYVANAGDSRCIVCRKGVAVDMSFDHKPEDEAELNRVIKAGGKVTLDGRVNGGLNLSRAIGDHAYKQNKELSDREQMITALPDVMQLEINPSEDEFMVLACDGIWNFMTSQEVVDFVRPRLQEVNCKLSQVCEEMFDHCLAPNTLGDGTGCDNMTAIIVQFKKSNLKRLASDDNEEESCKKAKTEEIVQPESSV